MKTLQNFSSAHAQVYSHFNRERHLVNREVYKQKRSTALLEWRALAPWIAARATAVAIKCRPTSVTLTTPLRLFRRGDRPKGLRSEK
jgi:hypothetical protein